MKKKNEISPSAYKFAANIYASNNCKDVQYYAKQGSIFYLQVVEGCYLQGISLGYWSNYTQMFALLRLVGIRYYLTSYIRFKRGGEFYYIPSVVVSALCSLVGLSFASATALGLERAEMYVLKNRDRWASFGVYPAE